MSPVPITPIQATPLLDRAPAILQSAQAVQVPQQLSFSQLLTDGLQSVSTKQVQADNMVRAFVLDDSIPVHQVTFALEQARLSLELMLQVRGRLVEGYQQLMNMQL
jgi:flagellar hook-basal body complex protein FliE